MFNFGPLESRRDRRLLDYFYLTDQFGQLVDPRRNSQIFIYIARPGSGKTAITKKVESLDGTQCTIVITPETTQLTTADDEFSLQDHKILIQYELFVSLISQLAETESLPKDIKQSYKEYIKKNIKNTFIDFFKDKLQGISVLGTGFTLNPLERRNYLSKIKKSNQFPIMFKMISELSQKFKPLVLVDDPEGLVTKGLNEVSPENANRIGTFLSALAILSDTGSRVIVLIKEHVFQSVTANYQDYTQFSDCTDCIRWTVNDLMTMLQRRLDVRIGKSWTEVFELTKEKFISGVLPLLVNGPRDLIFICNTASRSANRITQESIKIAARQLKYDKIQEIKRQFGRQWQDIDLVIQGVIRALNNNSKLKETTYEELVQIMNSAFEKPKTELHSLRRIPWVEQIKFEINSLMELLFYIGCFGFVKNGKVEYAWSSRDLMEFRSSSKIFVSPLFVEEF